MRERLRSGGHRTQEEGQPNMKKALSIAGSDSGGGAGIQADLKTFSAFGVHGSTVLTAVTAQNTVGVQEMFPLPIGLVRSQIRSVMEDIGTDAAKTGMLAVPEIIEAVASAVREYRIPNLVVDPVMAAHRGDSLSSPGVVRSLEEHLLPLADLLTPNIPEAEALTGLSIAGLDDMEKTARVLQGLGVKNVLIKGGHLKGDHIGCDLFWNGHEAVYLRAVRVFPGEIHGTGCTLSAAITAGLAKGMPLLRAIQAAKEFITRSIGAAYAVGRGFRTANPLLFRED